MIDEERALDGLTPLIARLAAAKHAASFRCAYWGGRAPAIATGMSLIGIALEEEGHARVLEALLGDAPGVSCAPEATVTWRRWPALADTSSQRAESWLRAMVRYAVGDAEVTAALHVLACSPWRRLAERARKIVREETFHAAFAADALSRIARPSAEARAALDAELDLAEQCSEREALEAALADAAGAGLVPLSALDAFDAHVSAALAALRRGAVPQESTLRCPRCGSASVRMLALYGSLLMTSQYRCSCGELFDAIRFSDDGLETAARET